MEDGFAAMTVDLIERGHTPGAPWLTRFAVRGADPVTIAWHASQTPLAMIDFALAVQDVEPKKIAAALLDVVRPTLECVPATPAVTKGLAAVHMFIRKGAVIPASVVEGVRVAAVGTNALHPLWMLVAIHEEPARSVPLQMVDGRTAGAIRRSGTEHGISILDVHRLFTAVAHVPATKACPEPDPPDVAFRRALDRFRAKLPPPTYDDVVHYAFRVSGGGGVPVDNPSRSTRARIDRAGWRRN